VDFRQALEKLSEKISSGTDVPARAREEHPANGAPSAKSVKLLSRVIDFYHTAFCEDARAREYLASRGISGNDIFSSYKIGFANGTILNVLPDDGDLTSDLKEIGVLNDSGGEFFYGCATFPLFDANGNPAGFYGKRIDGMDTKGPDHLYLPGERRRLFNRETAKSSREIMLCEAMTSLTPYSCLPLPSINEPIPR
jgi:DNA primase